MTSQTEALDTFMDYATPTSRGRGGFVVVHPLHDAPEAKCKADHLGPMRLSPGCRIALVAVRFYLVAIMLMGAYRVVTLMGAVKH
jgi:hypothetical protein